MDFFVDFAGMGEKPFEEALVLRLATPILQSFCADVELHLLKKEIPICRRTGQYLFEPLRVLLR